MNFAKSIKSVQIQLCNLDFRYETLSSSPSNFNISYNSIILKLACYLQNGDTCATYESCSTATFKHGRTETVRPCTMQTKAFTKAVTSSSDKHSLAELRSMIVDCSLMHGQLIKEATMGDKRFDFNLINLKWLLI